MPKSILGILLVLFLLLCILHKLILEILRLKYKWKSWQKGKKWIKTSINIKNRDSASLKLFKIWIQPPPSQNKDPNPPHPPKKKKELLLIYNITEES